MTETNIRIVNYGQQLHLDVQRVQLHTSDSDPDLLEKACRFLRMHHALAAVPQDRGDKPCLLVATRAPLSGFVLSGDDWRVEVCDIDQVRLRMSDEQDARLIARLFERYYQVQLRQSTNMWTLDSPRIWYEAMPFHVEKEIGATRRFHVSVVPIAGEGLGIVIHVSTAFFSVETIADFFDDHLSQSEQAYRQRRFEQLLARQHGQKGTLIYDLGNSHHKCYFREFLKGATCATTGPVPVNGVTYPSLHAYYECRRPDAKISPDAPVARVSFSGLDRPVKVAADHLRLRVMNTSLPKALQQLDKIVPCEREQLTNRFWTSLDDHLLGKGLMPGLWRPPATLVAKLPLPSLRYGQGGVLPTPTEQDASAFRAHFHSRLSRLNRFGCYHVPPTLKREIVVAHPEKLDKRTAEELAGSLIERLSQWTRKQMTYETVAYGSVSEAIATLNAREAGMVVFIFEDTEPETYYLLSAELRDWRIKRITLSTLLSRYRDRSFLDMNALDVLEQLQCVPWTIDTDLNYQAHLAIDVGVDRRYFALSLLICRPERYRVNFWIDSLICPKPDHRRETIEHDLLRDQTVKLWLRVLHHRPDPVESLLILRDGRESGHESEAVREAQGELVRLGLLASTAKVDIIDFAKKSLKDIRLWQHDEATLDNVLEGTALFVDKRTVVLANTGAATLHQGTVEPLVLTAPDVSVDMLKVVNDVFSTAQLNWSSPRAAKRLPIAISRADQELETRRAQEIRGLR